MKRFSLPLGLALTFLSFVARADTGIDANIFNNGPTGIQVLWNATPGRTYVLETTTDLAQPWQPTPGLPPTFTATTNWLGTNLSIGPTARFFRVIKLDTEGPEFDRFYPDNGGIGASPQAVLTARIRDETGINTNSISVVVGTNAPVTLTNPRLQLVEDLLTYTPATNEFLGTPGETVTVKLNASDTLGNQTTNFAWSFQTALPTVLAGNILFLDDPNPLTLLSTNGDTFTYAYTGASSGLSNGLLLVRRNLTNGYTRTVVSFTPYPASNTVVVLTRPTKLAELLQQGTLSSSSFIEISNSAAGRPLIQGLEPSLDIELQHSFNLQGTLYQDANFLVETLPGSQLTLDARLELNANISDSKLTEFQARLSGGADFRLDVHARAAGTWQREDSVNLAEIRKVYVAVVGGVPVWVEVVFEVNAGYEANLTGTAEITNGVRAVKQISVGRKWTRASNTWEDTSANPPVEMTLYGPIWQVNGAGNLRVYLQPKATLYAVSLVGVSMDLEPYLDLEGSYQFNPPQGELALYGGLNSTLAFELRV